MDGKTFTINLGDGQKNDEIFIFKFFITFDDLQKRPSIRTIRINGKTICSNENDNDESDELALDTSNSTSTMLDKSTTEK